MTVYHYPPLLVLLLLFPKFPLVPKCYDQTGPLRKIAVRCVQVARPFTVPRVAQICFHGNLAVR